LEFEDLNDPTAEDQNGIDQKMKNIADEEGIIGEEEEG
jgi:hypothetical protein